MRGIPRAALLPGLLISGLLMPGLASAEVHLQILQGTRIVGYATVSQWDSSGVKTVEMRMELGTGSRSVTKLHKLSTYDAQGHPIRMVLDLLGTPQTTTIATFDGAGAHISKLTGGVAKNSTVERAVGAPWEDASEFWFLRDQPKPGAHVRTLVFSVDTLDWVLTDVTFVGPKSISIGGKTVTANAIQYLADGNASTAYVDRQGEPIRVDLAGGIVMEQIVPKPKKGSS